MMLKPVRRSFFLFLIIDSLIERDDLLIKSTDVKSTDDLQRQLAKQKAENEGQKIELEKLRQALVERDAIIEEQDKRLLVDRETQYVQTVRHLTFLLNIFFLIMNFQEEDKSFVQVFAEPDVDTIGKLQAELDEKNRVRIMFTFKILLTEFLILDN